MTVEIIGCMEDSVDGWRPVWQYPCNVEETMIGCTREGLDGLVPVLLNGFSMCPGEKEGCMRLVGGVYKPVLIYEEYADSQALLDACCFECTVCWSIGTTPRFIEITFSDLIWCSGEPDCEEFPDPADINVSFICTSVPPDAGETCRWTYDDTGEGGSGLWVHVVLTVGIFDTFVAIYYGWCTVAPGVLVVNLFFAGAIFECVDTGPYDSTFLISRCSGPGPSKAYEGSAVIDWNPS